METRTLEEIGLTRSEALVYLALAELGPSATGKIIDRSGVASSKIYEILNRLELKGLASHAIGSGVKLFEAAPPQRIIDYISEKGRKIKKEKQKAEILADLLSSRMKLVSTQEATIYRGMEGLKTAFYTCVESMKTGDTIYISGVPSRSEKVNRFFVRWNKYRAKKGLRSFTLFNETAKDEPQALLKNNPLTKIRFIQKDLLMPAAINVFDDKIIIFPVESGDDPLLIMIRSKEIADSFRVQFKLLWNMFKDKK